MSTRFIAAAAAVLLTVTLSGCAGEPTGNASGTASSAVATNATEERTLTVFAAASMRTTFEELQKTFEADNPGVKIVFNFAGSQALATQLTEGAVADVFVSANDTQMKVVTDADLAKGKPTVFATNQLAIAVPPDNPANIKSFSDLTKQGLKLVVCAPAVPCGAATEKLETATGTDLTPVSEEQAVTDVLSKVSTGEADAGLVYKTDIIAAGDAVKGIDFPESSEAINNNPIVLLADAPQSELGQAWIDLVLGAEGQKVFSDAGFGSAA